MRAWLLVALVLIGVGSPALAQDADVAPIAKPHLAEAPVPPPDSNVAPFYASHPGTLVWLRDANTRAVATKLVDILKRAPIDGLADGPQLAESVQAMIYPEGTRARSGELAPFKPIGTVTLLKEAPGGRSSSVLSPKLTPSTGRFIAWT